MDYPIVTRKSKLVELNRLQKHLADVKEEYEFRKSAVLRSNQTSGTDWVVYSVLKPIFEKENDVI